MRANPYVDVYNLQPGQEICIPMSRPFPGMMPNFNRPQPDLNLLAREKEKKRGQGGSSIGIGTGAGCRKDRTG